MEVQSYDSICCFRSRESHELRLLWEITTKCNLNCSFCHRTKPYVDGQTFETIREVIPKIKAIGVKEIIISGGEPLIRNDIFEVIELLKESGFALDICTNAYAVDKAMAERLSNYFTEISVSLDSIDECTHNALRLKKDAYEKTLKGISYLLKANMEVHITILVNKITLPYVMETVKKLYGIGIRSIALIGEIPIHGGEYYIVRDEVQKTLKNLVDCVRRKYSDLSFNTKEIFAQCEFSKCPAAQSILAIDAHGRLSPCLLFGEQHTINLTNSSISDIISFILSEKNKVKSYKSNLSKKGICPGSESIYRYSMKEENYD